MTTFFLDHLPWVSLGTIFAVLCLAVFVIWLLHRLFPEKPSTTATASAVVNIILASLVGLWLTGLLSLKRDKDARAWSVKQEHLNQLRPVLKHESERLEDIANNFQRQGFMADDKSSPTVDLGHISALIEPDIMSSDLVNHY